MPVNLTRSLLVVFFPGVVAISPWCFLFVVSDPAFGGLYKNYFYLFNVVLGALAIITGSVIEGAVSHIESKWDKKLENSLSVSENWYTYLSNKFENEPVGYRYMSRIATTMYFELGMMCSSLSFILGLVAVLFNNGSSQYATHIGLLLLISIPLSVYFYKQAMCTHNVLCKARLEINMRIKNV